MNRAARVFLFVTATFVLAAHGSDLPVEGIRFDASGIDQARAEAIFASAEAAIYFPDLAVARWLAGPGDAATGRAIAPLASATADTLESFRAALDRDFPRFRSNEFGPFLLKMPDRADPNAVRRAEAAGSLRPMAAVFTESFESGLGNWGLDDNRLGAFGWGTTACAARTGSRSADALRGEASSLGCADPYPSDTRTTMVHSACASLAGASQAWLEAWIAVATESGYDTLGFYYGDASGEYYGYSFSGTWTAWFHVAFNLKQWYRVGDVTATSCPKLALQFRSDADTETGFGARVDDIAVGTAAPAFLSAGIQATPASGPAPLTVNFSPALSGGTAATFQWFFGDAADSGATTQNASFTYATPGEYWVRLRVQDAAGGRFYAHKLIVVTSGSACSLSCSATVPATARSGIAASFAATAAPAGCSGTPSYAWSFGDGQSSAQQNPQHAYGAAGTYGWSLTVSVAGQSCSRSGTIVVSGAGSSRRKRMVNRPDASGDTLATATIGPAGGTLSGGGFTLTVPGGAFDAAATLRLSKVTVARDPADVSDSFAIEGLPAQLRAPVTMQVERFAGAAAPGAGEAHYLSVEAIAWAKSWPADEEKHRAAWPLEATLEGNRVRATIPATWKPPTAAYDAAIASSMGPETIEPLADAEHRRSVVKATKLARYETAHFYALELPADASAANNAMALLETHYQRLTGLGFSFACRNDASGAFRKIRVDMKALGAEGALGAHASGNDPCGTNWIFGSDFLEITTSVPSTDQKVKLAAAHELFHLLQDIYSPGGAAANLWLKEASSIWLEPVIDPSYCPDIAAPNTMFPWNGLVNSSNSAVKGYWIPGLFPSVREANHGYGAGYALTYRTMTSGVASDPFVRVIWDNVKAGTSELAALQAALGSTTLPDFWGRFAKDYFTGRGPTSCFPGFRDEAVAQVTVANESALPQAFTFNGYRLGARSWLIDLQKFSAAAALPASVQAEGLADGQGVTVYDVKSKTEIAELTKTVPDISLADLKTYAGSILILVFVDRNLPTGDANAQSATNSVTLTLGSGLRVTSNRTNGGPGDPTPTMHTEWFVTAGGARLAPPGSGAQVYTNTRVINAVRGRLAYKAAPPNTSGCYDGTCNSFEFLGFTGREELWCNTCGPMASPKLLATASAPGAWVEAKDITMTGAGTSVGVDTETFRIRVYYRVHSKRWNEKTGAVEFDTTVEDHLGEGIRIEKQ